MQFEVSTLYRTHNLRQIAKKVCPISLQYSTQFKQDAAKLAIESEQSVANNLQQRSVLRNTVILTFQVRPGTAPRIFFGVFDQASRYLVHLDVPHS
jgi:hypothetical protein